MFFLLLSLTKLLHTILVVVEFLVADDQVAGFVAFNEDLSVCRCVNHLTRVIKRLALLLKVNADLADDLGELLNVVLHEVGLRFVVLLDTIELLTVLVPNLINVRVNKLDVTLVLLLSLARHQFRMAQFLLQSGLNERSLGLVR